MALYCVNKNEQSNGDHEVHDVTAGCIYLPAAANRIDLGEHTRCATAVDAAKQYFRQCNGCKTCSPACHTG